MALQTPASKGAVALPYEKQLDADLRWGMDEGDRHFAGKSAPFRSMRRVTKKLDEIGVDYAVAGGMALNAHGLRRFTEDVDILVSKDAIAEIHAKLEGRGYRPPFANSKQLRDTELGVRIEFLTSGDYPGDGKPKPVSFPNPAEVATEVDGVQYINLPTLIELKLASGMTNVHRIQDLADVQRLIGILALGADFAEKLNPYVRPKFLEMVEAASSPDPHEQ